MPRKPSGSEPARPTISAGAQRCPCCKARLSAASEGLCRRCGWDGVNHRRKCLKCDGIVACVGRFRGNILRWPVVAGIALLAMSKAGLLPGLALGAGVACFNLLLSARLLKFECGSCGWPIDPELVWKEETTAADGKRSLLTGGAMGFMLAGALLAAVWIFSGPATVDGTMPAWSQKPREALINLLQTSNDAPPQGVTDPFTVEWYYGSVDSTEPGSLEPQADKE